MLMLQKGKAAQAATALGGGDICAAVSSGSGHPRYLAGISRIRAEREAGAVRQRLSLHDLRQETSAYLWYFPLPQKEKAALAAAAQGHGDTRSVRHHYLVIHIAARQLTV